MLAGLSRRHSAGLHDIAKLLLDILAGHGHRTISLSARAERKTDHHHDESNEQ